MSDKIVWNLLVLQDGRQVIRQWLFSYLLRTSWLLLWSNKINFSTLSGQTALGQVTSAPFFHTDPAKSLFSVLERNPSCFQDTWILLSIFHLVISFVPFGSQLKSLVLKLCCALESPLQPLNYPQPRSHPMQIQSGRLEVGTRHQYFLSIPYGIPLSGHLGTPGYSVIFLSTDILIPAPKFRFFYNLVSQVLELSTFSYVIISCAISVLVLSAS